MLLAAQRKRRLRRQTKQQQIPMYGFTIISTIYISDSDSTSITFIFPVVQVLFFCFKLFSERRVVGMMVSPPYELQHTNGNRHTTHIHNRHHDENNTIKRGACGGLGVRDGGRAYISYMDILNDNKHDKQ